ncbi:MAG: DegQ family serine endoprotease [Nitrospiraceae bacterium]|nr:DegQ family serine endoprotease [Nitrospiraceae bacterium]
MKKSNAVAFIVGVLVTVLVSAFIASQSGCERMKGGGYNVVGFPQSFADLVERVKPAVVNISTTSIVKVPGGPFRNFFGGGQDEGPFGDFFHRFFGEVPDQELKQQSLGSGFIIDKEGYIITNNHVVQDAQEIKVKLADGREFKAKVVGRDPKTDLALIKISSFFEKLPSIPLGDSDAMRVGDWVLAIGNPFGLEETVTQGIISATGRVIGSGPYDNFLQTDAPINPGNSGGPLINLRGEVIGINTAIIQSGQGIGFSVPINIAKNVVPQLKEKGKVTRGWIGVSVQSVTQEIAQAFGLKGTNGALVGDVVAGGPAEQAGLKRGDVIVSFNGKEIKRMSDLPFTVAEMPIGKTVDVKIIRAGKELTLHLKIAEMPSGGLPAVVSPTAESLGLNVENITPRIAAQLGLKERSGVVVVGVEQGSPAEDAGIQAGDVIKEVNREPVRNADEYNAAMRKAGKNAPLLLLVKRGAQAFYVTIQLS